MIRRATSFLVGIALMACSARIAAADDSLVVTLVGKMQRGEFFGPPNWGAQPSGDPFETVSYLQLPTEVGIQVCGLRGFEGGARRELRAASSSHFIQVWSSSGAPISSFVGQRVRVVGRLETGFNGHHRTPLTLDVQKIERIPSFRAMANPPCQCPPPVRAPLTSVSDDAQTENLPLVPADGNAATEKALQVLLGPAKRLRDYATFVTERGETAELVLFVTDAIDPPPDAKLGDVWCGERVRGIPLTGTYHVGLVMDGKLVNQVTIPRFRVPPDPEPESGPIELPLKNSAESNHEVWGTGDPDENADDVKPTKLMRLADFNSDGHAWEFRLVLFGICGHDETLLAGYSPSRRQAIVFPIIEHGQRVYWEDNLFPSPRRPNATRVEWIWQCGDHGLDEEIQRTFVYSQPQEAWLLTCEHVRACDP
jgi:hypothetical protein